MNSLLIDRSYTLKKTEVWGVYSFQPVCPSVCTMSVDMVLYTHFVRDVCMDITEICTLIIPCLTFFYWLVNYSSFYRLFLFLDFEHLTYTDCTTAVTPGLLDSFLDFSKDDYSKRFKSNFLIRYKSSIIFHRQQFKAKMCGVFIFTLYNSLKTFFS